MTKLTIELTVLNEYITGLDSDELTHLVIDLLHESFNERDIDIEINSIDRIDLE